MPRGMRGRDYYYESRASYPRDRRRDYYEDEDDEEYYDMRDRRYEDGRRYGGRGRDYHSHKELDERKLEKFSKKLIKEVEEKDKSYYKMESILKRAEDMGIEFDEFTPYEFYVVVLMMFTDFCKALGTVNPDVYIKLAKYWLCDEDAAVQYGEKLAAYYESIVEGF